MTITPSLTKTKELDNFDYSLKKTISLFFDVHEPLITKKKRCEVWNHTKLHYIQFKTLKIYVEIKRYY